MSFIQNWRPVPHLEKKEKEQVEAIVVQRWLLGLTTTSPSVIFYKRQNAPQEEHTLFCICRNLVQHEFMWLKSITSFQHQY